MTNQIAVQKPTPLMAMAARLEVSPEELEGIVKQTIMPAKQPVSNEQFLAFLAVANSYKLDPLKKEIYAFPNKGAIVPVVGVDGWATMINKHPEYDGMEFVFSDEIETMQNAKPCPVWAECVIYRKDRNHPVRIREYLDEVYRPQFKDVPGPWQTHTKRFLRHKAMIQTARIAFGFVGIYDDDEAERIKEATERDITPEPKPDFYPADRFAELFPRWEAAIQAGGQTPENVIGLVESKGNPLTEEQKQAIYSVTQPIEGELQ